MKKNGYLVISLDFELIWGVFDVVNAVEKKKYFLNTRKNIPEVLELFEKSNIHATWATVGMLFNKNWEEWEANYPDTLPNYQNHILSAYKFGKGFKKKENEVFCFAPELIRQIKQTGGQELATHTYSHYYCLENGQDAKAFESDLQQAIVMAGKMDVELKSLVFPRNQLKAEYLKICRDHGILNVRSNPSDWYWKDVSSNSITTKLARTGDAYLPLGKKSYDFSNLKNRERMPLEHKASRFLRPVEQNEILRKLKLERIKSEMTIAAKNNEIYHLWWHPHNFGDNPQESMKDLNELLTHYRKLNENHGFQSANMAEIGALAS